MEGEGLGQVKHVKNDQRKPMESRRGACAKPRASRGVLRHAPRGESTVAGFWARNIILFL